MYPRMEITLYNTLHRRREAFVPREPGKVGLYTCGPTVYNYMHIGNLRTFLFEDLLTRFLRFSHYEVKWVMNITDVGHMTSDGDEGDDKMTVAAKREKKTPWELAEFYGNAFIADMVKIGIDLPDVLCKATDHVTQMIEMNAELEKKGFTYQTSEGLYFDTSRVSDYGKLANLRLDEQKTLRDDLHIDPEKRNPADFILWFANKPSHIMKWFSPWGEGYPGWHIECSAMSMHYLGESFDIHCGGNDHIPVHHTNEIAQSEAVTGKPFVKYWMHTAFLTLSKEKMAKSSGNFLTVQTLINSGYDPIAYRYLCLQAHYRSELALDWVWDGPNTGTGKAPSLDVAAASLKRLYELIARVESEGSDPLAESEDSFQGAVREVMTALSEDINLPQAVGILNAYKSPRLWRHFDPILGLDIANKAVLPEEVAVPEAIAVLLEKRQAARNNRDFAQSDAIRKEIATMGWEVADTPQGQTVKISGKI
jgi:cysteinyl-tRNA synthetase